MIARFTAAVSEAGINIDSMTDKSKGDYAYSIIDVDGKADEKLVKAIEEIEGVIRVRVI